MYSLLYIYIVVWFIWKIWLYIYIIKFCAIKFRNCLRNLKCTLIKSSLAINKFTYLKRRRHNKLDAYIPTCLLDPHNPEMEC
jgi:hypothetical protein